MSRSSGPTCRALSNAGTLSLQNSKCLADQVSAAVEFFLLFHRQFLWWPYFLGGGHRRNLRRIFVAGGDKTGKPQFPPRASRRKRAFVISFRLAGCVNFKLA